MSKSRQFKKFENKPLKKFQDTNTESSEKIALDNAKAAYYRAKAYEIYKQSNEK